MKVVTSVTLPLLSFAIFAFANSTELGCENSQKSELERCDFLLPVYLKALSITHFKNYHAVSLGFSSSLNFITGKNGAGKTNLLDGIHYLCLGKSYFHGSDQQSVKFDERFFRMEGAFDHDAGQIDICCVYPLGGKKELTCNDVAFQRLTDHVGTIPVVMIAPDDQSLINEGSDERRRFIDNTISQIDHLYLEDLVFYNKVLQQRNAALKNFAVTRKFDAGLVEALDLQLTGFGEKIFTKRVYYLEKLSPLIENYYRFICEGNEHIKTVYQSVFQRANYNLLLKQVIEKDRLLERTTEGIHRDEFDFFLSDQPVRKFGSQGQKKTFLMSLKLAQWELIRSEKSKKPLLLLDDLFDKLDAHRSAKILKLISGTEYGQVFITDTETERPLPEPDSRNIACKRFLITTGSQTSEITEMENRIVTHRMNQG